MEQNPVGLDGMEFIEFTGPDVQALEQMLARLGFAPIARHKTKKITLFRQNDIHFLVNSEPGSFAQKFAETHGPSVCSTGFRVKDKNRAFQVAVERGARPYPGAGTTEASFPFPAVYGIGNSVIYFVDEYGDRNIYDEAFVYTTEERAPKGFGLSLIDHLTNNVPYGEMDKWCRFYEDVFNFKERRYFDIKGSATGLLSKVMRSPCNKITIPINEPDKENSKSQIQEYLDEYKGSGIQHIALLTDNILDAVIALREQGVEFLDTPETYYDAVSDRVPNVTEDLTSLKHQKILVDGDPEGYLLQIFTQNMCGPIFFEIIQRKNHQGFGEGNFQALFEAIERDQQRRGVI